MLLEISDLIAAWRAYISIVRGIFSSDNLEQGGLTRTVSTEERYPLAWGDRKCSLGKQYPLTKMLLEITDLQHDYFNTYAWR
jgi:hypothetical protein